MMIIKPSSAIISVDGESAGINTPIKTIKTSDDGKINKYEA